MAAKGADSDTQTLADIIVQARKRVMNVALVIGKDGLSVAADPRKPPEVMWREAKKAGGGSKGGMGTCTVEGKELQIRFLTDDFPATLLKALKQKLRDEGQKFKPVFFGPDGTRVGDDEDEGAGGEAPAEGGEDPAAALRETFAGLEPAIAAASATAEGRKVASLAAMFAAVIEKDVKKAGAVLGMLTAALDALPAPGAARATAQGGGGLADLEAKVDALLAEFA